jgi:hypothetical protein
MHAPECLLLAGAQVHFEEMTPSLCVALSSRAFCCIAVFVRLVGLVLACNGEQWFAHRDTHLKDNAASSGALTTCSTSCCCQDKSQVTADCPKRT